MKSTGEEDEEEYFESLQDTPSSSSSESGEEDKAAIQILNSSQAGMGKMPNAQIRSQAFVSPYEIWKSNPGTIQERRQRLLIEMGLEPQIEEPCSNGVQISISSSAEVSGTPSTDASTQENVRILSAQGRSASSGLVELKSDNLCDGEILSGIDGRGLGWCMMRSRSDGSFSTAEQNDASRNGPARLVRSGSASPFLLQGYITNRLVENSGAVLRTGASIPAYTALKPPLGGKRSVGMPPKPAGRSFTRERAARLLQSCMNNADGSRISSANGTSPLESGSLGCNLYGEALQKIFDQGRYLVQSSVQVQDFQNDSADVYGDVLCRIKNLDSGKEFVVNELGKDGLWNKLKELDTGRELTLEEFESSLGLSPIVQEVMRRERAAEDSAERDLLVDDRLGPEKKRGWLKTIKGVMRGSRDKRNRGGHGSASEEKEGSNERSGRMSGSATDDSQETPAQATKRMKVHSHRKSLKEFTELHMRQEFQAHQGAIWTMKFSMDGHYLASAGQDRVVRVWEVLEQQVRARDSPDTSGELNLGVDKVFQGNGVLHPQSHTEAKKGSKGLVGRKKVQVNTTQPSKLFILSEKPRCSFQGHTEDILDLSWSTSQFLLSSSMDKTVRLWHVSRRECLRVFTHNDYVTCIQFNPVNDGYFISGSLDDKVRIWSIQDHKVVDWADLREMVTAACYKPDGQGAVVGTYKGTCRFYNTSGNKLQLEATIDVRCNKGKKSNGKKITGFQFIRGDRRKVLITSSDSRIRVYDGTEISSKYKGFRNTRSQISASFSSNGKYIICASEDSRVCIWNYNSSSAPGYTNRRKEKSGSYEDFCSRHVLVAIPWPGMRAQPVLANLTEQKIQLNCESLIPLSREGSGFSGRKIMNGEKSPARVINKNLEPDLGLHSQRVSFLTKSQINETPIFTDRAELVGDDLRERNIGEATFPVTPDDSGSLALKEKNCCFSGVEACLRPSSVSCTGDSGGSMLLRNTSLHPGAHCFFDSRGSATWPEEKLPPDLKQMTSHVDAIDTNKNIASVLEEEIGFSNSAASAWGLVIVTAGLGGEIQTFQNYGLPVRI